MEKENKLVKNIFLYTIGNFGSKILIMLIVPIYTYYIDPEGIGYYDLVTTSVNLLCPILILSIQEGIYRWLLLHRETMANTIKNGMLISGVGLGIGTIIFIPLAFYLRLDYAVLILIIGIVQCTYTLLQEITRGLQNIKLFSLSGIGYSLVFLISNIVFVCILKMGVKGLLWSLLLTMLFTCTILICFQKDLKKVHLQKDFHYNSEMVKYSVMLIPNNVSWWLTSYADRYMIRIILGMASNGIYAIATKFPSMLSMITGIFYSAWQEQAFLYYDKDDRDEYYSKIFNLYSIAILGLTLFLTPFTKLFIIFTMSAEYHSASSYVGFLYLGCAFQAFAAFYGTGYLSAKKTGGAMVTTVVGAIINILINLLFMNRFGLQIAGISTFLSYFVVWLFRIFQTRKLFTIKIRKGPFVSILLFNLLIILLSMNTGIGLDIIMCLVTLVIMLLYNKTLIKQGFIQVLRKVQNKNET